MLIAIMRGPRRLDRKIAMTKPGIRSVAGALGLVALLLGGCGFAEPRPSAQYAALNPQGEAAADYGPPHILVEKPVPVRSLLEMRHHDVVIQSWDLSCGAAALATLLRYESGDPVTEKQIARRLMSRGQYVKHPQLVQIREGFSLLDLKRYVQANGFKGEGFGRLDFNDLIERAPIMVPVDALGYNHFVIFRGVMGDRVLLADPAGETDNDDRQVPAHVARLWKSDGSRRIRRRAG